MHIEKCLFYDDRKIKSTFSFHADLIKILYLIFHISISIMIKLIKKHFAVSAFLGRNFNFELPKAGADVNILEQYLRIFGSNTTCF